MRYRRTDPRPHPLRRPARPLTVLLLAAALLASAGCVTGDKPQALDTTCAVVVDGSGSGSANKGFDAKAKLNASIVPFMKDQHCGSLAYAPITASSKASPCHISDVDLDPPSESTDDVEAIRQNARVKAVAGAHAMLTCAHDTNGGSDVLGGIARAAEALPSEGAARRCWWSATSSSSTPSSRSPASPSPRPRPAGSRSTS